MKKDLPSYDYLHSLFRYDPETGHLLWRVKRHGQRRPEAGWSRPSDYVQVRIDGRVYNAHRLIWKMVTGADPEEIIDHRNGTRNDNRWSNLRAATLSFNQANSGVRKHNTTGFKGVSKCRKMWVARICFEGKQKVIGRFKTKEDAHAAYQRAATNTFGEFARFA